MKSLLLSASFIHLLGGTRTYLFSLAVALQVLYLAMRGISLERLPLVGPHDTIAFMATSIGVMGLPFILVRRHQLPSLCTWSIAAVSAIFTLVSLLFKPSAFPLPPILDTFWFECHVALAFFGYALFTLGAVFGLFFLLRRDQNILNLQYQAALTGYSLFSASMVTGGIWGYYAWGTYWLWTPKEIWTSILWLFYSFYLHFRLKGNRWDLVTAWGGVVGFIITMFTYLGVSLLMKSSHSF